MSDLLREALEIIRDHRTSCLDPADHSTQIVKPDVCESCGDALTKEDVVLYSLPDPIRFRHELYCRECSDVVRAIRRSREREIAH